MTLLILLAQNLGLSLAMALILWRVGVALKDVTLVDAYWPLGMVVLAWASLARSGTISPRKLVLVGLCTVWGLRLGGHLLLRWRSHGPDRRYVELLAHARDQWGWGLAKASLLLVFGLQAPLQVVVSLPVQLGQVGGADGLGPLAWMGVALGLVGLVFETVGDAQLARFKADPARRGTVLDTGLWRYSRHPNYFGDFCLWWGLYLIGAEGAVGLWALPGPVLLTVTLLRWSGAPTVEGPLRKNRPGYEDYCRRTSAFLPWPPKRAAESGGG